MGRGSARRDTDVADMLYVVYGWVVCLLDLDTLVGLSVETLGLWQRCTAHLARPIGWLVTCASSSSYLWVESYARLYGQKAFFS